MHGTLPFIYDFWENLGLTKTLSKVARRATTRYAVCFFLDVVVKVFHTIFKTGRDPSNRILNLETQGG